MWTKCLGAFLSLLMVLLASGVPARAAAKVEIDNQIQSMVEQQKQVEVAAAKLKPYLVLRKDGTFALNVTTGDLSRLGVGKVALAQLRAGMDSINQRIKLGEFTTDSSANVFFKGTTSNTIQSNENSITVLWYGFRWGLSNTLVQRLIGILTIGGGVAGIAAAITGAIPAAGTLASAALWVVAGAIAAGIGWLTYLNAPGRGVFIYTSSGAVLWGTSQ